MSMTLKQSLKPDWRKIVIFVVLSVIFLYLFNNAVTIGELYYPVKGFPLPYYYNRSGGMLSSGVLVDYIPNFNLLNFILDLIFWYLLSCLVIWIYDKFRKRK